MDENKITIEIVDEAYRLCEKCFHQGQYLLFFLTHTEDEMKDWYSGASMVEDYLEDCFLDEYYPDECERAYVDGANLQIAAEGYLYGKLDLEISLANGVAKPMFRIEDHRNGDYRENNFLSVHSAVIEYLFRLADFIKHYSVGVVFSGESCREVRERSVRDAKQCLSQWRDPDDIQRQLKVEHTRISAVVNGSPFPLPSNLPSEITILTVPIGSDSAETEAQEDGGLPGGGLPGDGHYMSKLVQVSGYNRRTVNGHLKSAGVETPTSPDSSKKYYRSDVEKLIQRLREINTKKATAAVENFNNLLAEDPEA